MDDVIDYRVYGHNQRRQFTLRYHIEFFFGISPYQQPLSVCLYRKKIVKHKMNIIISQLCNYVLSCLPLTYLIWPMSHILYVLPCPIRFAATICNNCSLYISRVSVIDHIVLVLRPCRVYMIYLLYKV